MTPVPNAPSRSEPSREGLASRRVWGNFELLAMVGRGSFGEVYRAWDPSLQREVALKILLPTSAGDEKQFEDLLREARALASVRHPNIVPIYGVDRHDGLVGFWTDFVHGKTLSAAVREQGAFSPREAALIGLDVTKALSAVHRAGLLHRDIKAENVMRESGGRILLMDFGLSTSAHRYSEISGTPRYMAPELFTGALASVASDIYAVGVLLFYLVTGEYPSQPEDGPQSRPQHSGDEEATAFAPTQTHPRPGSRATILAASRSIHDYRPDLPEPFARVVDKAIDLDPLKRFSSAGALTSALSDLLAVPVAEREELSAQLQSMRIAQPRSRWPYAVGLAVLLLVAGFFALRQWGVGHGVTLKQIATPGLDDKYLQADKLLLRYDKRKNVADAVVLLKEVLAKDENFALAQAGLGRAYYLQYRVSRTPGLLDQARVACNRAIAINSSIAPPYITLARIEAMAGNTALATQDVQKALQLDPRSADAYGAQAEVFDAEGRSDDAIASVQQAMLRDPDYWRWPVLLGSYYFAAGKLQEAAEQYRKAIEIAPDNATALLDLGLASIQLERYGDARENLEKSAQLEPSTTAYSALAELLTREGKFAESVEISKKCLDLNPTRYVAWGNLGAGYLLVPDGHDKAIEAYRKAIELAEISRKETPEDAHLLADLGVYYTEIGRADRSLPLLHQAVALAPDDPNVLILAGDGYELLGHRSEAIHLIAKSLALGYHANQLQTSPELAALRADPKFQEALNADRVKLSLDTTKKTR